MKEKKFAGKAHVSLMQAKRRLKHAFLRRKLEKTLRKRMEESTEKLIFNHRWAEDAKRRIAKMPMEGIATVNRDSLIETRNEMQKLAEEELKKLAKMHRQLELLELRKKP